MLKSRFKIIKKLFGADEDHPLGFRVRLFNIMAAAGIIICLIIGISGIFIGASLFNFLICMLAMVISIALLWYSFTSGKYQLCYTITCFCIFLILFPALFFSGGGYYSSSPSFFVFAILFTIFMLEGKKMIIMTIAELVVYVSICIYAYYNKDKIVFFNNEKAEVIDIIIGFVVASIALGVTMALHLNSYNKRQTELETARKQVEEYAKMKSELFAGMSHEMRTPLTVMSAYAQFAVEQIKESGANKQTLADLATISDEAKRLAEMADSTLKILMTSSATYNLNLMKKNPVDIGELSSRLVHLLKPIALRKEKILSAEIAENIPIINGDADALMQLLWNLMQNAITHSNGKSVIVNVDQYTFDDNFKGIKLIIKDDGTGIELEILPFIFEHGISGKEGGSGIGLSICRYIANRHGGDISIVSGTDGVSVSVLLRELM